MSEQRDCHQRKMPRPGPHIKGFLQAAAYRSWGEEGRCDGELGMLTPHLMRIDLVIRLASPEGTADTDWHCTAAHTLT